MGTVIGWGSDSNGQNDVPAGLDNLSTQVNTIGFVNTNVPGNYTINYFTASFLGALNTAAVTVNELAATLTITPAPSSNSDYFRG